MVTYRTRKRFAAQEVHDFEAMRVVPLNQIKDPQKPTLHAGRILPAGLLRMSLDRATRPYEVIHLVVEFETRQNFESWQGTVVLQA
ncbi:MAG: hypothetical protein AAF709_09455 [Pseudomonadota bacterium]